MSRVLYLNIFKFLLFFWQCRSTVKPLNVIATLNVIRHAKCYNIGTLNVIRPPKCYNVFDRGTLNVKQIQLTLNVITIKILFVK